MAQPLIVDECDPMIETCEPQGYQNTIELDYFTPNMIVGILSEINLWVPVLFWYLYRQPESATDTTNFSAATRWDWGWKFTVK